jgi:phosphoribosylaminoimidazole-succinocarboxamide synthase
MNLRQVNEGDIIQVIELKIPKRTIERFNSINFNTGKIFIVYKIVKERFVELLFYDKKNAKEIIKKENINNKGGFLIISKYYFDKIEVKILEND